LTASAIPHVVDRRPLRLGIAGLRTDRATLAWCGAGLFVLCLFARSPDLFRHPRFWAEEGNLYFQAMRDLPLLQALGFVVNGNYQFLTDLFVEFAILAPPHQAAVPTTYLPLLLAGYAALLMARLLVSRGCSVAAVLAACALFALQTAGYEVFLSATNVQWVCSVVALLLALQDDVHATSGVAWRRYALLGACGLTGTPSCILLPLFLVLAWLRPNRYRLALAGVLAAAAAIQLGILLAHAGQVHRAFEVTPKTLVSFAMQTFLSATLPVDGLQLIGGALRDHGPHWVGMAAQVGLFGFAGLAIVALLALDRLGNTLAVILVATAVETGLVNAFGQLGRADDLLSSWGGARYFFASSTCLILMLACGLSADAKRMRVVAGLLVAVILGNGALSRFDADWSGLFLTGPSVSAGVEQCRGAAVCRVPVAPHGFGLTVDMRLARTAAPALH
jgi:hypothetical protein